MVIAVIFLAATFHGILEIISLNPLGFFTLIQIWIKVIVQYKKPTGAALDEKADTAERTDEADGAEATRSDEANRMWHELYAQMQAAADMDPTSVTTEASNDGPWEHWKARLHHELAERAEAKKAGGGNVKNTDRGQNKRTKPRRPTFLKKASGRSV